MITTYISNLDDHEQILILGDFNVPDFAIHGWSAPRFTASRKSAILRDFSYTNDLCSLNTVLNFYGNTLDLIFSDVSGMKVEKGESLIPREDKYHPPLRLHIPTSIKSSRQNVVKPDLLRGSELLPYVRTSEESIMGYAI